MLVPTDPFRELDRLTQQVFGPDGAVARPSVMPMDAWRDGDTFHVELDLPGVASESTDLDVERNVVTVRAERAPRSDDAELVVAAEQAKPRKIEITGASQGQQASAPDEVVAPVSTLTSPTRSSLDALDAPDAKTLQDELVDLLCADEQWLHSQFDAIMAAGWPAAPSPPTAPGVGHRGTSPGQSSYDRTRPPAPASRGPTLERWRRVRSPPPGPTAP